jgi:hypothetical protein
MEIILLKPSRRLLTVAHKIRPAKDIERNLIQDSVFFLSPYVYLVYANLQGNRKTGEIPVWNDTRLNVVV